MYTYKSYCWSLGTTSFRTADFNVKIEKQLELLASFWKEHSGEVWSGNDVLQAAYYDFMHDNGFLTGAANNKPKDAREKTSGLIDLGLISENRLLTEVGEALRKIAVTGNFAPDNLLQVPSDSYIYFKQLLKTSNNIDGDIVRPFIVLILVLEELEYLTKDEFTYLLPLITSEEKFRFIVDEIKRLRKGQTSVDEVIVNTLMTMDNYQEAYRELMANPVTEDLICKVGMNRKSRKPGAKQYDKPYYSLYVALKNLDKNSGESLIDLLNACSMITIGVHWKKLFFKTTSILKIRRLRAAALNRVPVLGCETETELKEQFFKLMHLFKAKATLADYYDLNKRYFGITDTVSFKDGRVELTLVPKCFFNLCMGNLKEIAFRKSDALPFDCGLEHIIPNYRMTDSDLYRKLETDYGIAVKSLADVQEFVDDERHRRFNELIDSRFSDKVLLELLSDFEARNDSNIRALVTNNADIPTIFEYIVGIIWYKVSNREGRILDFLNLSLDADLLPKTHAAGGSEDITYQYEATSVYPKHSLLIELTLADRVSQRRMEMEPVSRHLGDYLLSHEEQKAYALFVTTFLHVNVVSDFRGRKNMQYYSSDGEKCVEGMKIIPFQTSELKTIIRRGIRYEALYPLFENAYQSVTAPNKWYTDDLAAKL